MAAEATPAVENPYAPYGLNADGTPLTEEKPAAKEEGAGTPDPRDVKIAGLERQLGEAMEKLKGVESYGEKFKVVDKLVKAFSGDEDPNAKTYAKVWADLKQIVPAGVRKAFEALESDPDALEKLSGSVAGVQQRVVSDLNIQAHGKVVELAKKAFPTKGLSAAEVNELVFPFERAITDIINSNKTIRDRFVSGDLTVVEELFNRLSKAHVSGRLREKQARLDRLNPEKKGPVAPPKSGGPNAGKDDGEPKKPDIHSPKGRAAFHKAAVSRFFDKRSSSQDEE